MAGKDYKTPGGSPWTLRFPRKLPITKVSWEEFINTSTYTNVTLTDILTDIKVRCTKQKFINVPEFTYAAITDTLTNHKVRYAREDFVNCSVNIHIAITDIKTIAKLMLIFTLTDIKEELANVQVASTQFTEIQAGTKVAITDILTDNKVRGTKE